MAIFIDNSELCLDEKPNNKLHKPIEKQRINLKELKKENGKSILLGTTI